MADEAPPVDPDLVDPGRLSWFLANRFPDLSGPFELRRLGEGQSCLTFSIRGTAWEVILRRPPRGELPPTAYDVTREFRVMHALTGSGVPVPVPRPVVLCDDPSVIGAPFYLMEPVHGVVVRNELPDVLASREARRSLSERLVDVLVALHAVDPTEVGLEGFGKPQGYLERQLHRMRQLWDRGRFRDLPEIETVGTWLADNLPPQGGSSIVHGDYKLDNVILGSAPPPTILAVIDWEMSTLGDPLADLGWLLYYWRDPGEPPFQLPVSNVTDREGFLRRRDLLERYAARSGRTVDHLRWYMALAGWKIAIIMEASYGRYLSGVADHPSFAVLEREVPTLVRRAGEAILGALDR